MNSKQRFNAVCNFQNPDRFPIDYLAHPDADKRLKAALDCRTETELLDRLACDFYYLSARDLSQNEGILKCYKGPKPDPIAVERTCPLGIRYHRGAYTSKFFVDEAIAGPLRNAETSQEILNHPWPHAADFDFSPLHAECDVNRQRVIIGGLWTGIMGDSYRLIGFENFLMNIALQPELIKTLIDRMTEMYLELNNAVFAELKGKMDIWFFGNDFGSQNGLLVGRDMWCDFFFEPIKQLAALAHSYGLKVMMHSCGSIAPIIPDLIAAGVDILDPIQVTAQNMSPAQLATDFGGKIVFHGGIDTQQILPNAAPQEVRDHARETLTVLGRTNGYIFAPSQILGPDIPTQNIIAMYETAKNP